MHSCLWNSMPEATSLASAPVLWSGKRNNCFYATRTKSPRLKQGSTWQQVKLEKKISVDHYWKGNWYAVHSRFLCVNVYLHSKLPVSKLLEEGPCIDGEYANWVCMWRLKNIYNLYFLFFLFRNFLCIYICMLLRFLGHYRGSLPSSNCSQAKQLCLFYLSRWKKIGLF